MDLFKTKNLTFSYPHSKNNALDGVAISVKKGEFVLVMGKSGSGKSTLLRLLNKELSPYGNLNGEVEINTDSIGFVVQNPSLSFVSEKVRGELAFALENQQKSSDEISLRIGEIASFFDVVKILDRDIATLSGGEKATVAIAAAMIGDVSALILDEPLSQLDAKAGAALLNLLKRVNDELGITIIMSSHICEGVITLCDRIIVLENGKVICNDEPGKAVQNSELLPFFPLTAKLFEEHPLTVKDARKYAGTLFETEYVPLEKSRKSEVIISAKHITFAYEKKKNDILSQLDFTAYRGKINSIIGANGSGKTTLLKILAGIKKPYSGRLKAYGKIAYMPQNVKYLFTKDSVSDEILFDTAKLLGIEDCLDSHPFDLSEGQAQRLAFGILLEQNPDIFLLDEPTKSLDGFNKNVLEKLLKELCSAGKTVIMVSHDLDFAGKVSDFVSFLSDGEITVTGDRRQVFSRLVYFTTTVRRITKGSLHYAVSEEDII